MYERWVDRRDGKAVRGRGRLGVGDSHLPDDRCRFVGENRIGGRNCARAEAESGDEPGEKEGSAVATGVHEASFRGKVDQELPAGTKPSLKAA